MQIFSGICASKGYAVGPVHKISHILNTTKRETLGISNELKLFEHACDEALNQLTYFKKLNSHYEELCDIFDIQRYILTDCELLKEVYLQIKRGAYAELAVFNTAQIFAEKLRNINDKYFSERSSDVLDICTRVIHILNGNKTYLNQPKIPFILACEEVYPTDIVCAKKDFILGIASAYGSENAHSAVIARNLKIPFIVMLGNEFFNNCSSKTAIIDANFGKICLSNHPVFLNNANVLKEII